MRPCVAGTGAGGEGGGACRGGESGPHLEEVAQGCLPAAIHDAGAEYVGLELLRCSAEHEGFNGVVVEECGVRTAPLVVCFLEPGELGLLALSVRLFLFNLLRVGGCAHGLGVRPGHDGGDGDEELVALEPLAQRWGGGGEHGPWHGAPISPCGRRRTSDGGARGVQLAEEAVDDHVGGAQQLARVRHASGLRRPGAGRGKDVLGGGRAAAAVAAPAVPRSRTSTAWVTPLGGMVPVRNVPTTSSSCISRFWTTADSTYPVRLFTKNRITELAHSILLSIIR